MTNANRNRFAGRVQDQVIIARQNAGWRREYMDWKMTLLNERIKGREEGLAEGLETGLTRGLLLSQINIIKKKVQKGIDLSEIAEDMEMDVDSIRPVW